MVFDELVVSTHQRPSTLRMSSWAEPGAAASRPRRSEGSLRCVAAPIRDPSLRRPACLRRPAPLRMTRTRRRTGTCTTVIRQTP